MTSCCPTGRRSTACAWRTTQKYELNGRVVAETKITSAKINGAVASDSLAIPDAFRTGASKPATGAVPFQWVLRRQFIGTYLDSDAPSYDTKAGTGLRLVELAPGVQHAVGGSHHSLIVEMKDHLVVFDAPVSDWQSNWVMGAAKAKYPNKPVKFLVLTHHHMDHAGGLRAYAAQGATLVVGQGTAAHYRRVLAAPFTRNPDLTAREPQQHADRRGGGPPRARRRAARGPRLRARGQPARRRPADRLRAGGAAGLRHRHLESGRGPLPEKLNPALASLVAGVKKAGITPARFAGGHGSVADYAPLAALEGK